MGPTEGIKGLNNLIEKFSFQKLAIVIFMYVFSLIFTQ
jgi:hypothetical protein